MSEEINKSKRFDKWNELKKVVDSTIEGPIVRIREIWWCCLGQNIGSEQNGGGNNYERPVLVLRKYTHNTFLGLPLTTREKNGSYYVRLNQKDSKVSYVILSQARVFDTKRMLRVIRAVSRREFLRIVDKYKELI